MTVTKTEIKDIKQHLIDIHSNRRTEQETDKSYYEDTFSVPLIKDSKYIIRTGAAAALVEGVTSQLLSDNPQVFRKPLKDTAAANTSAQKVASFLNRVAQRLQRQNPNRYKESFKNQLVLGEMWLYTIHNENFDPDDPNDFPFNTFVPDPLVVYFDPREGEVDGVPNRIMLLFERTIADIRRNYPLWIPPSNQPNKKVSFLIYFDNEIRYFEASDAPLLTDKNGKLSNGDGIQENIYKQCPFVHAYSGFGKDSPDGKPASLAVGRLRRIRDLFKEDCTMGSDISFIIHKYAHRHLDIINKSGTPISPSQLEQYDMGPGIIQEVMLPEGAELVPSESLAPVPEIFQHFANIQARLSMESPPIRGGFALGTSGRQEDIVRGDWRKQYDTVLNNTEQAFSTALGQGLRMMHELPNLMPKGLSKSDIAGDYNCTVELRAEDPIEKDRLSVAGRAMVQVGQLSLRTNLIKHQGYTEEEADDEIDQIMAERYMFQSPEIAELMQIRAAEKSGMVEDVEALKQRRMQLEKQIKQFPLGAQFGTQGGEPRTENIQSMRGLEESDLSRTQSGQRTAPR